MAGHEYLQLIVEQLDEERKSKDSIEKRAITVITTAGTLVTLLLALIAVLTGREDFDLKAVPETVMQLASAFFVFAAILALLSNRPMNYEEVKVDDLERLTNEQFWQGRSELGSRRTAEARVKVLRSARIANKNKARLLELAIASEVAGVIALSIAVSMILEAAL